MSLEELLCSVPGPAGIMGLLAVWAVLLGQCWGLLGEMGSILTMAGAELTQTDWDKTTGERKGKVSRVQCAIQSTQLQRHWNNLPGLWFWSMEGRPCRMRVLDGAGFWVTGRVVTHMGLGWMGGLGLRIVLVFNVAELGRTSGERSKCHISWRTVTDMDLKRSQYGGFVFMQTAHCFCCTKSIVFSHQSQQQFVLALRSAATKLFCRSFTITWRFLTTCPLRYVVAAADNRLFLARSGSATTVPFAVNLKTMFPPVSLEALLPLLSLSIPCLCRTVVSLSELYGQFSWLCHSSNLQLNKTILKHLSSI